MEKEKQQDNPKMSLLTKILLAGTFAVVSVSTCGCGYMDGYNTYPTIRTSPTYYRYRSPFFSSPYPRYRFYDRRLGHPYDRYRGYPGLHGGLRITIPFDKRDSYRRGIRPNIQRPQRNYPTPRRNPSTPSRPERNKK